MPIKSHNEGVLKSLDKNDNLTETLTSNSFSEGFHVIFKKETNFLKAQSFVESLTKALEGGLLSRQKASYITGHDLQRLFSSQEKGVTSLYGQLAKYSGEGTPVLCYNDSVTINTNVSPQLPDLVFVSRFENDLSFYYKTLLGYLSSSISFPKLREYKAFKYKKAVANDVNILFASSDSGSEYPLNELRKWLKTQEKAVVFIEGIAGIGKVKFNFLFSRYFL